MNTELIEKYILNQMTAEEKAAFEKDLASNPELRKELETQQKLMQAIDRSAMKTGLQQALKRYILKKNLMQWSIGIIITAAVVAISYYAYKNTKTGETNLRYETNELSTKEFADADKYLPSQLFTINNNEDTIVETKDGIVFAIPAHAFKNPDGTEATGKIDIEIKEALNTADIIKAGLSTKSNDELLETGGMFYFNARIKDKNLSLVKEINAGVPTDEVKPGMKLFEGARSADGTINWVKPVELDKELTTYNITDLDFYPPNYIPTLQKLGLDYKNKKFTDSLYYSFARFKMPLNDSPDQPVDELYGPVELNQVTNELSVLIDNKIRTFKNATEFKTYNDSLARVENTRRENKKDTSTSVTYEINPSRIGAIWNKKFNNTILATKEFEERLKYIQSNCGFQDAFELYVHYLDKPLYYSDSIISMFRKDSRFEEFYMRHDGGVKVSSKIQQKLSEYYLKRSALLQQAAEKTWRKMYEEEAKKDIVAQKNTITHEYIEKIRVSKTYIEEYDKNLKEACDQLGCKHTAMNTYNAKVNSMGWKNIDRYVAEATASRTTLDYTDPITGKKAVIKYTPFSVTVNGIYDRTLVYLIPHELSIFQKVKQEGNVFKENLNEFIKYDAVVVAYKGDDIFCHIEKNITPINYTFNLDKTSQDELNEKFRKLSKEKRNDMRVEIAYQVFAQKDAERKRVQLAAEEQRRIIAESIFPCLNISDAQKRGLIDNVDKAIQIK